MNGCSWNGGHLRSHGVPKALAIHYNSRLLRCVQGHYIYKDLAWAGMLLRKGQGHRKHQTVIEGSIVLDRRRKHPPLSQAGHSGYMRSVGRQISAFGRD